MVRKHSWENRLRMKRTRPTTPAPKDGWVLGELATLTGLPETTLRYYVAQKLIRPIQRRGTATRYGRRELLLILGFLRRKSDGTTTLIDKKRELEAMGNTELERWLCEGPMPEPAAQALGFPSTPQPSVKAAGPAGSLDIRDARFEQWQRIPLMAGLDLMLRADAKTSVRAAAQQIYEQYVAMVAEEWQP